MIMNIVMIINIINITIQRNLFRGILILRVASNKPLYPSFKY